MASDVAPSFAWHRPSAGRGCRPVEGIRELTEIQRLALPLLETGRRTPSCSPRPGPGRPRRPSCRSFRDGSPTRPLRSRSSTSLRCAPSTGTSSTDWSRWSRRSGSPLRSGTATRRPPRASPNLAVPRTYSSRPRRRSSSCSSGRLLREALANVRTVDRRRGPRARRFRPGRPARDSRSSDWTRSRAAASVGSACPPPSATRTRWRGSSPRRRVRSRYARPRLGAPLELTARGGGRSGRPPSTRRSSWS